MRILAFEQSTALCSLALVCDGIVVGERAWTDARSERRFAMNRLENLLRSIPNGIEAVDLICVGLGPGAYTGLRMALVAARAMALPDNRPVYGVASAEVLASEIIAQGRAERVCVLGDARRFQVWHRAYARCGNDIQAEENTWQLANVDETLPQRHGALVVSSDLERLSAMIQRAQKAGSAVLMQPVHPTAAGMARLVLRRIAAGKPSEPLTPIYLHGAARH